MSNQSVNPRSGEVFGPIFPATTPAEVSQMIESAVKAFGPWSQMGGVERGRILSGLADAIDAQSEKLIEIADSETGLGKARLTGEGAGQHFR